MSAPDTLLSAFPEGAQILFTSFVGVGLAVGAAVKYLRPVKSTSRSTPEGDHMVLSASIADGQAIRDLTKALLDMHGTIIKVHDLLHEMRVIEDARRDAFIDSLRHKHIGTP